MKVLAYRVRIPHPPHLQEQFTAVQSIKQTNTTTSSQNTKHQKQQPNGIKVSKSGHQFFHTSKPYEQQQHEATSIHYNSVAKNSKVKEETKIHDKQHAATTLLALQFHHRQQHYIFQQLKIPRLKQKHKFTTNSARIKH